MFTDDHWPGATRALTSPWATLADLWDSAHRRLADDVWDFLVGGSGNETTLRDNRSAFAGWRFRPRVMSGIAPPDLSTTFLGVPLSYPVFTAPFGAEGLFHPEGHLAVARANAAAGVASIVPEASTWSLEAVAGAAPAAARIFQLHPMGRPEHVLHTIRRAESAGYDALCFTLDCPTAGWRERNLRNRFSLGPEEIGGNYPLGGPVAYDAVFGQLFRRDDRVWSWDELAAVCAQTRLPWMAKGILTSEDARAAVAAGASAVLVSTHGGRQLDCAPAALAQLPEVVAAVEGRARVALDSGIRRGSDVVTALALGADVVVVGRLAAAALAAGGQAGLERMHHLLREEMRTILMLLGAPCVPALDRSMLQPATALAA
jgi:4-hydroxymandelate oxidase